VNDDMVNKNDYNMSSQKTMSIENGKTCRLQKDGESDELGNVY
jgi:hypothetical protein